MKKSSHDDMFTFNCLYKGYEGKLRNVVQILLFLKTICARSYDLLTKLAYKLFDICCRNARINDSICWLFFEKNEILR